MLRFVIKFSFFIFSFLFLTGILFSDTVLFDVPADKVAHYKSKLSRTLHEERDLSFLVTFDEPEPLEWITQSQVYCYGTEVISGRYQNARYFDGSKYSFCESSISWNDIGHNYTISIWINLEPSVQNADILFSSWTSPLGFTLENGYLHFYPGQNDSSSLSFEFSQYGEFIHLAGVVNADTGLVSLYKNGSKIQSKYFYEVDTHDLNITFGMVRWYGVRHSIHGAIDEVAIWSRPLSSEDIYHIYVANRSLLMQNNLILLIKYEISVFVKQFIKNHLKRVDLFDPRYHEGRVHGGNIPDINLYLTKSDLRYFNSMHNSSLKNGRRTIEAAKKRKIHLFDNEGGMTANMYLHGADSWYPDYARKSFIVESLYGYSILGARKVLFQPPESRNLIEPLFNSAIASTIGVPHILNGLCRIFINGDFIGVYYYEDFSKMGMLPINPSIFAVERRLNTGAWRSLFDDSPTRQNLPLILSGLQLPLSQEKAVEIYNEIFKENVFFFLNDKHMPLGRREIHRKFRNSRDFISDHQFYITEDTSSLQFVAGFVNSFMFVGENVSPYFITSNLQFDKITIPDIDFLWASSNTEIISDCGEVHQPKGEKPVEVQVSLEMSNEYESIVVPLSFRVMPNKNRVPALMIYVNEFARKTRRIDSVVYYYGIDNKYTPHILEAHQSSRGGIKHRGNTSHWEFKKPFSIRFDSPHNIIDKSETKHLHLRPAHVDQSFIRDGLAHHLFRSFSTPYEPRYAPKVQWAEIFINGYFWGLYEIRTRVDGAMLGWESTNSSRNGKSVLYRFAGYDYNDLHSVQIKQKIPSHRSQYYLLPLQDFTRFVGHSATHHFQDHIYDFIDINNVIDMHILTDLTSAPDIIRDNIYLARYREQNSKFFFIPWDFDKSFFRKDGLRENPLFERLLNEIPEYRFLLYERWQELRKNQLDIVNVFSYIENVEAKLDGYIEFEFARWGYNRNSTHSDLVNEIKDFFKFRIEYLDVQYKGLL